VVRSARADARLPTQLPLTTDYEDDDEDDCAVQGSNHQPATDASSTINHEPLTIFEAVRHA